MLPFDLPSFGALPRRPRIRSALRRALSARRSGTRPDHGMSTAEYAVGTLAAVAFAGVLYAVVSSAATHSLISSVVQRALSVSF
ncbi:DUF4244 domain-containing protein [Frankia sp. AgB32]|uniref:DUF4244 domain-containing protein n=1 Tax=Frankia sp. AgB32 TaxID=631119 RepID=UPI00200E28CF|nr:DUF4244 domain-containing protein [Frankia sp. AgB32]MCK9895157.1 DUF4244 domain-containing protein [Frankia sp. AgB32]